MSIKERVAAAVQMMGPISIEWRDAKRIPGGSDRPARFWLQTRMERDANIGGGFVSFSGSLDAGGNSDQMEAMNSLGRHVAEAFSDVSRLLASVRVAYEDRHEARREQRVAEERLARVLRGGRATGQMHVAIAEDGAAWLQDPEKRDRGLGFRFDSLGDLWRSHPDLRPVAWGADERGPFLTVESFAMGEQDA